MSGPEKVPTFEEFDADDEAVTDGDDVLHLGDIPGMRDEGDDETVRRVVSGRDRALDPRRL